MNEFFKNQIALAMIVFIAIIVGAFWKMEEVTAKDVIIQVITAVCALVTGQLIERDKSKRTTDIERVEDKAQVAVAQIKADKMVETAKTTEVEDAKK